MRPDRLPWVLLFEDDRPRPEGAWQVDVDAAATQSVTSVLLGGGEPAQHPQLPGILSALAAVGRRPIVLTDGRALGHPDRLTLLAARGLVELSVWADSPGLGSAAEAARSLGLRVTAVALHTDGPEAVAAAAQHGLTLRLLRRVGRGPGGPRPRLGDEDRARVDATWQRAAALGVSLVPDDLGAAPDPHPPSAPPPRADANLLEFLGRGVIPQSTTGGVRLVDADPVWHDHALMLPAAGLPPVDAPPCLGGIGPTGPTRRAPGCEGCPATCPGLPTALPDHLARPPRAWNPEVSSAVVVLGWVHDELLPLSTFPGLARELSALGVDTVLHSVWDVVPDDTLDPPRPMTWWSKAAWWTWRAITRRPTPLDTYTPPPDRLSHPHWGHDDRARIEAVEGRFLREIDLTDRELVVVAGYRAAGILLDNPTLSPDARIVVADLHMLQGAAELANARNPSGRSLMEGAWWPDRNIAVHNCFPRYGRLYRGQGIPLDTLWWRPYPIDRLHFRSPHHPVDCDVIFAGGRHHRDYQTLAEAAPWLDDVHPIDVYVEGEQAPPAVGPIRPHGGVPVAAFTEALQRCRFLVLPLHHDVDVAAGITVLSMAHAAGRPVITTLAGATLDAIRDGEDGLLVPPGDPEALAHAIRRLDHDPDLLRRLAAGAERAGERLGVRAWAIELAGRLPPQPPAVCDDAGVWHAWAPLEDP